jgi:predicted DNA-binding transcriptional regulator YafY
MKLYKIYKDLIIENTARNSIIDAIDNHYRVRIFYSGDDNTAAGARTIEVYAYGTSQGGNQVIRAYQVFGDTKTVIPQWKLFRVDRITRWEPTNWIYREPVSDRGTNIPKYNHNGDNSMVGNVYNAKF